MTGRPVAVAAVLVGALVVDSAVLARLPVPGAAPALLLPVVVLAVGLVAGRSEGLLVGFLGGLGADLLSDAALGRRALVLCLVGYAAGLTRGDRGRGPLATLVLVATGTAAVGLLDLTLGLLLGDPRARVGPVLTALPATAVYAAVLAALVVPLVVRLWAAGHADELREAAR